MGNKKRKDKQERGTQTWPALKVFTSKADQLSHPGERPIMLMSLCASLICKPYITELITGGLELARLGVEANAGWKESCQLGHQDGAGSPG